jgi:hypothetical protein
LGEGDTNGDDNGDDDGDGRAVTEGGIPGLSTRVTMPGASKDERGGADNEDGMGEDKRDRFCTPRGMTAVVTGRIEADETAWERPLSSGVGPGVEGEGGRGEGCRGGVVSSRSCSMVSIFTSSFCIPRGMRAVVTGGIEADETAWERPLSSGVGPGVEGEGGRGEGCRGGVVSSRSCSMVSIFTSSSMSRVSGPTRGSSIEITMVLTALTKGVSWMTFSNTGDARPFPAWFTGHMWT